jgi:hypothetical protein
MAGLEQWLASLKESRSTRAAENLLPPRVSQQTPRGIIA